MNNGIIYANVDVSVNWETLLRLVNESKDYDLKMYLANDKADKYDLGNAILMQAMCTQLVEALQTTWNIPGEMPVYHVVLGNKFFVTMNEQQQQSSFLEIFALPLCSIWLGDGMITAFEKPEITIHTVALLDALSIIN